MVFNPNMDTRLSSPQNIGATSPIQLAAPSGAATAVGALAGLAQGFGDAWVGFKSSEAAAAKSNAPSYGEENDIKAQAVFNDPAYIQLAGAVPQTASGFAQHKQLKSDFLLGIGSQYGPEVQKIVGESFGITLAGDGAGADSPGATQASMLQEFTEKPENLDIVLSAYSFDPDGQINPEATRQNLLNSIATQSQIERIAADAARMATQAGNDELTATRVRKDAARQAEVLMTSSINKTANGAVAVWLSNPSLTANDALAELEETELTVRNRARETFTNLGLDSAEYGDRLDAVMKPIQDLKTMITNNIGNETVLREALGSAQKEQLTNQMVTMFGLPGMSTEFQSAMFSAAAANSGMANQVTALLQSMQENKEGNSLLNITINGLGKGQNINQVLVAEGNRVESGGEPVVTPEVTRGVIQSLPTLLTELSIAGGGQIKGGDAQLQTAYLSLAVEGQILTLRDGKGPLQTVYNAKTMTVYNDLVGSGDAQAADAVNEFVNMSVKQRVLNLSMARGRIENSDLGVSLEKGADGRWAVVDTTYNRAEAMAVTLKTGLIPYNDGDRYDSLGRELDYKKVNSIAAQLNYMEGQFAANPELNALYQSGGEVNGETAASDGRAPKEITAQTGSAPAEYDLSTEVINNLNESQINFAAQVKSEEAGGSTSEDTTTLSSTEVDAASKLSSTKGGVGKMLQSAETANFSGTQLMAASVKGQESFGGDYNAFNTGNAGDVPKGSLLEGRALSDYTVREIMDLQDAKKVFAVGAYQTIPTTLAEGVNALGISDDAKFDEAIQDRIFEGYLIGLKRKPVARYLRGESDDLDAAVESLAKEFASFPSVSKNGVSFYDDVGGNEAKVTLEEARQLLQTARDRGMSDIRTTDLGIQGGSASAPTTSLRPQPRPITAEMRSIGLPTATLNEPVDVSTIKSVAQRVTESLSPKAMRQLKSLGLEASEVDVFDSQEEAQVAINSGELKEGDAMIVDGELFIVEGA